MKKLYSVVLLLFSLVFLYGTTAIGSPLDLSGFTAEYDPEVAESGGVVTFTESIDYSAIYFVNDSFVVDDNATTLSFNSMFE